MNINKIITDFQSASNLKNDKEVSLFRNFAMSMINNSRSFFIDETHGKVAQVSFDSIIYGQNSCEISDLLIVIKNNQNYKATFWQAKREPNPNWKPPRGKNNFDFRGQFNQWELLSSRPKIVGNGKFQPPSTLLSNAISPSIGSFGVFYENNGLVELNYSIAEFISVASTSRHPKMIINEKLSKYPFSDLETIVSVDLQSFLNAINNFSIGSIIDPSSVEGNWLLSYIENKCKEQKITEFFDSSINPNKIDDFYTNDGVSILLINSEPNKSHQRGQFTA